MTFLPYHRPDLGEDEIAEVVAAMRSGWITTGPKTAQFEAEFREYVQARHALATNSCTASLHLALAALGLGPGDEVITTALTFCATVNTILQVGATPVLADIDEYGNLDPASVESRITPRTRCILPVHLAGTPCRMRELWTLARRHGLFVVEDAAHAAGTHYAGRPIGAGLPEEGLFSDAVAWSFYATKNITTGEGGMVTTHNADLDARMRVLCLHGISRDAWARYTDKGKWFYEVTECGFKYNLSDIQSAIGIHQLRRLEGFIRARAEIAALYRELLSDVPEIELPREMPDTRHAWHIYMIRLRLDSLPVSRDRVMEDLKADGIGASVHFIPIPLHAAYRNIPSLSPAMVPETMALYPRIISLPLYPGMTAADVRRVAGSLKRILAAQPAAALLKPEGSRVSSACIARGI
jgi:dTDP-4-amino-4,6-dideoxygalactose transaminase